MGRWQDDARGRLEQAALALYAERGFEHTTVAEIAARAGLTERTFFRHFADKREVLFGGVGVLRATLVNAVAAAPVALPPIDAVAVGLRAAAALLQERRDFARRRAAIIAASAELRERELIKLATLADALAGTLRARGASDTAARLAAELGMAVFRVGFERWIAAPVPADLADLLGETLTEMRALTATTVATAPDRSHMGQRPAADPVVQSR